MFDVCFSFLRITACSSAGRESRSAASPLRCALVLEQEQVLEQEPEKLNEAGEVIEAAVPAVTLNYGNFLQQTFDFLIIAFCIFLMVKGIAKLSDMKKKEEAPYLR